MSRVVSGVLLLPSSCFYFASNHKLCFLLLFPLPWSNVPTDTQTPPTFLSPYRRPTIPPLQHLPPPTSHVALVEIAVLFIFTATSASTHHRTIAATSATSNPSFAFSSSLRHHRHHCHRRRYHSHSRLRSLRLRRRLWLCWRYRLLLYTKILPLYRRHLGRLASISPSLYRLLRHRLRLRYIASSVAAAPPPRHRRPGPGRAQSRRRPDWRRDCGSASGGRARRPRRSQVTGSGT